MICEFIIITIISVLPSELTDIIERFQLKVSRFNR